MKKEIIEEVREAISDGTFEIAEEKKPFIDKKNLQASIRLPRELTGKARLNEYSEFRIVFNPNENTLDEAIKSKVVIYLKWKRINLSMQSSRQS